MTQDVCKKCSMLAAVVTVRSDPLCADCFARFVNTKVVKRMEGFRTRYATAGEERCLLLPVSFGVGSLTLLHVLDRHLVQQCERYGRTGYALRVLYVGVEGAERERLAMLREKYRHPVTVLPLAAVFESADDTDGADGVSGASEVDADADHTDDADQGNGTDKTKDTQGNSTEAAEKLTTLLAALTPTSTADVISILKTRLIANYARRTGCEAVLWGSSTTRLAETALAETAKGRGFALPWHLADGPSPYGVAFHHPLRDVLGKELTAHAEIVFPELLPLVAEEVLPRGTIDGLMRGYFASVEESYPSIVSNVVRTTGKLKPPPPGVARCALCSLPVEADQLGIYGWGGDQAAGRGAEGELCYGCSRAVPAEAAALLR
ncbi:hypothetical protein EJ06DRAFT_83968 [Trichodelitschia bisporula]|uniref:Cytoplasmic tRNA 2-thiolation protein 2 n=1 Tax=Trichodelitschia bisporula TaxID=703511 RepID=A0A6G1HRC4_9PEZI|nr:hypothetical protein EJ06DRAFT_83968 [Trichodelitschia bisporula]